MSTKGVYTALSGAMAQNTRLETIANNLANVNTPAYKRDEQTFQEYLTAAQKEPAVIQVPRVPASIESFYDMLGTDKSFVDTSETHTDFTQGLMKSTGNSFDLAIDGEGLFEVVTPGGVKLTRNGSFTLDGFGQLVTKDGYPVLLEGPQGEQAPDPQARLIRLKGGTLNITEGGQIFEDSNLVGKISIVKPKEVKALQKVGSSLYTFRPNYSQERTNVERPKVQQGSLEMSNVNIVREMTDMIAASRLFESTQKAIQAYDQMNDKLVNVVGKTN